MSAPRPEEAPWPEEITLVRAEQRLEVRFIDGTLFDFPAAYLRVESPSAEVQGHGGRGGRLPRDKDGVAIIAVEPVGNYAVRLVFDDGHDSGLYSWDWLWRLGVERAEREARYRRRLSEG